MCFTGYPAADMTFAVYLYAQKSGTEEMAPSSVEVVSIHLQSDACRRVPV